MSDFSSSLEIFRLLFGLILFADFFSLYKKADQHLGVWALVSLSTFNSRPGRWSFFGSWKVAAERPKPFIFLAMIASLLVAVGLFTKPAALLVLIIFVASYHRSPELFIGGHSLAQILLFFLILSPAGSWMSLDRHFNTTTFDAGFSWAQTLMKLQINLMYAAAVFHKVQHVDWRRGTIIYKVTRPGPNRTRIPLPKIFELFGCSKILSYAVIVAQLVLPVGLWAPEWHKISIIALAALHFGFSLFLKLSTFNLYVIAALILFLNNPEVYGLLGDRLARFLF